MKKLILFLFFLIILGGGAFFFGWAQLSVPLGSYAVMRSKTHGVYPELLGEGRFVWVWYKLIPTNVHITSYKLANKESSFTISGKLPSGEAYAEFAGIKNDFSYELSVSVSFSLNPASLLDIVEKHGIDSQEALDAYEASLAADIRLFIEKQLASGNYDEDFLASLGSGRLEGDIRGQFPAIGNLAVGVTSARFPDTALYRSLKGTYENYLRRQEEYVSSNLEKSTESRLRARARLDELTKYGELLTKYPVLLDYLKIEGNFPHE